jgi:hypothetical protein
LKQTPPINRVDRSGNISANALGHHQDLYELGIFQRKLALLYHGLDTSCDLLLRGHGTFEHTVEKNDDGTPP